MRFTHFYLSLIIIFAFLLNVRAQDAVAKNDSLKTATPTVKNLKIGALLVSEYRASLTENVDIYGLQNENGIKAFNGFFLRYVRISGNYQINDRISATVLVNLADFKNNPQTRVLENAYIKYKFGPYAELYVGQYRPFFGLEDLYPYEFRRSYVWSNQYEEFGKNGWQSFQLGLGVTGSLKKKGIPLSYYFSLVNGNGKNMASDNDPNKDITWRLEYQLNKHLKIGVNQGISRFDHQNANAIGIDMQGDIPIAPRWILSMDAEYKNGTNFNQYTASQMAQKQLKDFRMNGIYFTPNVKYKLNTPYLKSLEFSTRYEYFEQLTKNGNPRTTVTPFFGMLLADDYAAKLSFGIIFDRYRNQIANSNQWNANLFFAQFQFKF